MFKLAPREPELARDGGSGRRHNVPRINPDTVPDPTGEDTQPVAEDAYIFTGAPPLHRDGRIWMATDIHDPLLRSILFPEHPGGGFLREKCDYISDGWYGNGTLAKVKTIMRYKIQTLAEGRTPDDGDYLKLLTFPNHAADEDEVGRLFSFDPQTVSNRDLLLATEVRAAIKGAPNWRGMRREKREGEKKFESEGEGEEELEERELMGEGAVES